MHHHVLPVCTAHGPCNAEGTAGPCPCPHNGVSALRQHYIRCQRWSLPCPTEHSNQTPPNPSSSNTDWVRWRGISVCRPWISVGLHPAALWPRVGEDRRRPINMGPGSGALGSARVCSLEAIWRLRKGRRVPVVCCFSHPRKMMGTLSGTMSDLSATVQKENQNPDPVYTAADTTADAIREHRNPPMRLRV